MGGAKTKAPITTESVGGRAEADTHYPTTTLTKLAFGSCHMNRATAKEGHQIIWPSIRNKVNPQSFLWLGDAVYSPKNKTQKESTTVAPLDVLEREYVNLLTNSSIGYSEFLSSSSSSSSSKSLLMSVHGTHDDHDYGANDYGKQMPNKKQRKELFSNFISMSNGQIQSKPENILNSNDNDNNNENKKNSNGLYTSIEYGAYPNKVKVILLDTRYSRDYHCPIPSIGAWKLPFKLASPLACVTRWISAGLKLQQSILFRSKCERSKMLSEEQWLWLEEQLDIGPNDKEDEYQNENENETAAVYIIGSSVQVLTTNPAIESWGHYPQERLRLMKLLNDVGKRRREGRKSSSHKSGNSSSSADSSCGRSGPAVVLLSGDVHHAEILDSSVGLKQNGNWNDGDGRIIEVTSSGLTHSCIDPFYGPLCAPILETFPNHRHESIKNYYTGRNFGSIEIQWGEHDKNDREGADKTMPQDLMEINVHNLDGEKVLTTGLHPLCMFGSDMTEEQLENIVGVNDGHLIPYVRFFLAAAALFFLLYKRILYHRYRNVHQTSSSKKTV